MVQGRCKPSAESWLYAEVPPVLAAIQLQSYEKSRAEQKILIFFMPRQINFASFVAKLRKKCEQAKNANLILLFPVDKVMLA